MVDMVNSPIGGRWMSRGMEQFTTGFRRHTVTVGRERRPETAAFPALQGIVTIVLVPTNQIVDAISSQDGIDQVLLSQEILPPFGPIGDHAADPDPDDHAGDAHRGAVLVE
jgi:hypothetical protein